MSNIEKYISGIHFRLFLYSLAIIFQHTVDSGQLHRTVVELVNNDISGSDNALALLLWTFNQFYNMEN